jgi:hypothetical protein
LRQNSEHPIGAHLALWLAALEGATKHATLLAATRKIPEAITAAPGSQKKLLREGLRN